MRSRNFAIFLLAALRGSIFLYQGEELGLPQAHVPFERLRDPEAIANWPETFGRDGARTPMPWRAGAAHAGFSSVEPWLPVDPAHAPLAVDLQEQDPASTLHAARRALALRKRHPVLRTGAIAFCDAPEPLLLFQRGEASEAMLCVFNLGDEPLEWRLPEGWGAVERVNFAEDGSLPPLSALLAQKK